MEGWAANEPIGETMNPWGRVWLEDMGHIPEGNRYL